VRALPLALLLFAHSAQALRPGSAEQAYKLMSEERIDDARPIVAELMRARPADPDVAFVDGVLKFMDGEYGAAWARLEQAGQKRVAGEIAEEIRFYRELAKATDDATRGFQRTEGEHFTIFHAPGKDALLSAYALETLEKAYTAVGGDFGVQPRGKIRVEIYPEVADLAHVSTLTLKEIETSGTIALRKFNRLMIVSPRALLLGYPWLDTLTHEYTHFVVTRASRNTVPIWLHEGLAKFEERRWKGAAGGALTPVMEHLLAQGLAKKHLITFEQMHPSMAKLPSQEDTALAFAEVYTVVELLVEKHGWQGVRKLIAAMRDGKSDAAAVAAMWGKPFDAFQRDWRAWLAGRKLKLRPGLLPNTLKFRKNAGKKTAASEDDSGDISEERARRLSRLGGMLRGRHRLRAAAAEYEKAQAILGPGNPQVASKLARTWLELGDLERAIKTAEPALELYPDQAGVSATLGEALLRKGELAAAETHLSAAIAVNPFDPALHCGLQKIYAVRRDPRAEREAAACRALGGE